MKQIDGKSKDAEGGWKRLLIPLLAVTIVGGGGGGFVGFSLLAPKYGAKGEAKGPGPEKAPAGEAAPSGVADHDQPPHGAEKGAAHGQEHGGGRGASHGETKSKDADQKPAPPPAELKVKELPPIVANLAGKERAWVRIQTAIVYDPHELEHVDTLIPVLLADITAFVGTLELSTIEGPEGLRRLQEELSERAATRSERRIRELIIEALVVQ